MSVGRNRRVAKTAGEKQDSINREREAEASAEKKIIFLWQSFDQMFGKRWGENFGSDPLGKADQQNRMQLWIDTVKPLNWPVIKSAVRKIIEMPKPNEWWLPDLQAFKQVTGLVAPAAAPAEPPREPGTWVDKVCQNYLIRLSMEHGPFSPESQEQLFQVRKTVAAQYNELMTHGELPSNFDMEEANRIRETLAKRFAQMPVRLMTEEEKEAGIRKLMSSRSFPSTKANSSSPTPPGQLDLDAP